MQFQHIPVLLEETIEALQIHPDGIYVDGTVGGGGHSLEIAKQLTTGKLIGIDQDDDALNKAAKTLAPYKDRVILIKNNYENIEAILEELNIQSIDGALLDIGVSSYQLDEQSRGFTYHQDAPLDMRMDQDKALTAQEIVNTYSSEQLAEIFWKYGEERWGKRIAEFIIKERAVKPIETTDELVSVIKKAIPRRKRQNGHPARKVFQALRIEVNDELNVLTRGLHNFIRILSPKGRLAVITFHSLEDRIVKQEFREMARACICPKDLPVCICHHKPEIKLVNTKSIVATQDELKENRRSRSAKLRIAEKL